MDEYAKNEGHRAHPFPGIGQLDQVGKETGLVASIVSLPTWVFLYKSIR